MPYVDQVELFLLGFFNGTTKMSDASTSEICRNSILTSIQGAFSLLDFHEFWWPDQILAFLLAYEKLNKNVNLAYAYCNFSQPYLVIASILSGFELSWIPNLDSVGNTELNIQIENGEVIVNSAHNHPRVQLIE